MESEGNSSRSAAQRRLLGIAAHVQPESSLSLLGPNHCNAEVIGPLDEERSQASFDVRIMTYLLDGGEHVTQYKEMAASVIESDEILRDDNRFDLSRPEARERTMEKVRRVIEISGWNKESQKKRDIPRTGKKGKESSVEMGMAEAFWYVMSLYDPSWATRIGVHFGLFLPAIQGQGTEEQLEKYLPDIQGMKIVGCFAMTELGHGSYIRGFETTATYNKNTQEFIINSPTETSTKFWIGMAGQTATHSVTFARLIIGDHDYGVHSFIVPLRSLQTGEALPGISVGDCGAKYGRNGLDNGWIQYHNVRVPRENMLMRWAKVTPDGVYHEPPKAQLSYGALIGGRVGMIMDSSDYTKKALTIAIRYSAIRRQFPNPQGTEEEKILNYQTHQFKLLPVLATCFAYHLTGLQIKKAYESLQEELAAGDITNLVGVHATSAGLKAFSTWWCTDALEQCRQALGGHGYSAYSGLPSLLSDFAVMCSWEGDNTVMAQQTAKFLVKTMKNAIKGKPLGGFEKYLGNVSEVLSTKQLKSKDLDNHQSLLEIMNRVSTRIVSQTGFRLETEKQNGKNKDEAWNECMVDLVKTARAHCDYFVLKCFIDAIEEVPESPNGVRRVLSQLCNLHAYITIDRYLPYLLEDGLFNSQDVINLHQKTREHCKLLRKDAVPLVDSFNIPDFVLNSPLGRYDGQVYSHYLAKVKNAPNAIGRPSYWEKIIKPMLSESTSSENLATQ